MGESGGCGWNGDPDIGVNEIVTLEEERFVEIDGEGIRKAVTEVEFRRMPAALAELEIGSPSNSGLSGGDVDNIDGCDMKKFIEVIEEWDLMQAANDN